ncbi:MAG: murein hydrolase activator EnvC family protein [Gaiellaceae bacterium]
MARRLALLLLLALVAAAPAAGGDIHRQKRAIDERLSSVSSKIAHAKAQAGVLTQQIGVVTAQIRALQSDVVGAQQKLDSLDAQLAVRQRKLDRIAALYRSETKKLVALQRAYAIALARLNRRVLAAYETPGFDAVDVMLSTTSMSSMLNDIEYLHQIGAQDRRISDSLLQAKTEMRQVREKTARIKARAAAETAAVRAQRDQAHSVAAQLISSQQQLATARASKRDTLNSIQVNEQRFIGEANALKAESAALQARIQAAQKSSGGAGGTGAPPASGFIWPVQGPITSPYGSRCLANGDCSFHPGIDIGVPTGTPIKAVAAGTVIFAGVESGYGNLTVIDHGNGLATAYGHQSSIAVGVGTVVTQGQVIGLSGCTGYCFGPHLHFEVRVNGSTVDPMRYL